MRVARPPYGGEFHLLHVEYSCDMHQHDVSLYLHIVGVNTFNLQETCTCKRILKLHVNKST